MSKAEMEETINDPGELDRHYKRFLEVTGFPEEQVKHYGMVDTLVYQLYLQPKKTYHLKKPVLVVEAKGWEETMSYPIFFCEE